MTRKYNSSYSAQKLEINFNLKMWRQDVAEFIRKKKYWDGTTRVSKSKRVSNDKVARGIKSFKIYNGYGGEVEIQYENMNSILRTDEAELINEYLMSRGLNN